MNVKVPSKTIYLNNSPTSYLPLQQGNKEAVGVYKAQ